MVHWSLNSFPEVQGPGLAVSARPTLGVPEMVGFAVVRVLGAATLPVVAEVAVTRVHRPCSQ